jgi:hypothetical protein
MLFIQYANADKVKGSNNYNTLIESSNFFSN